MEEFLTIDGDLRIIDGREGTDVRNRQDQSPEADRRADVLGMNYSMRRRISDSLTTGAHALVFA